MKDFGVYIHIPFCEHKCSYCDFFSLAGSGKSEISRYFDHLNREIELFSSESNVPPQISTIYIGGGTPSSVPFVLIDEIIGTVYKCFGRPIQKEITIEVNPHSAIRKNFDEYLKAGINRLSIGIQSLNDKELRALDRIHTRDICISTLKSARTAGFSNISIDLIFGIPGQTINSWKSTLDRIIELKPEHISAYSLMLEPGTKMTMRVYSGKTALPDEAISIEMFELTRKLLTENGYTHYEISNYSLPGNNSIHNSNYWELIPYKGFGLSSHSYFDNIRTWNTNDPKVYCDMIDNNKLPEGGKEKLDIIDRINETIMLGLRKTTGFSFNKFGSEYGDKAAEILRRKVDFINQRAGFGVMVSREDNFICLSKKSLIISDEIISSLLFGKDDKDRL